MQQTGGVGPDEEMLQCWRGKEVILRRISRGRSKDACSSAWLLSKERWGRRGLAATPRAREAQCFAQARAALTRLLTSSPPDTELGCENCSLVSKPFQSRQTVDSCSQPRFPRCTARRPRSALPARHSLGRQHLADHSGATRQHSNQHGGGHGSRTNFLPQSPSSHWQTDGTRECPWPLRQFKFKTAVEGGSGMRAHPAGRPTSQRGARDWPPKLANDQGNQSRANHGPHHRSQRRGSRGRPPVPLACGAALGPQGGRV